MFMQYQVKVAEYPGPMKGQLEVVIGTTKESVETLMSRRMSNLQVEDNPYPATTRERSNSTVSRLSDCSVVTTTSMPPNYSQLNSRAVSLLSLDTCKTRVMFQKLTLYSYFILFNCIIFVCKRM